MQQYLLSFLIFTPLIAAFIILFTPPDFKRHFKRIALAASIAQLVFLVFVIAGFTDTPDLQFIEKKPWITLDLMGSWGLLKAEYFLGIDGLNFPLVCLAVPIMLLATVSSWNVTEKAKAYFSLLLILNAAIIGSPY